MNIQEISVGMEVILDTGDRAEVVSINDKDLEVRVLYLDALGQPELVGSEAWVTSDEIIAIDMGSHSEGRT